MAYTDSKKKTILDTKLLTLYGKNDQGKSTSWNINTFNNQIQITVWTNVPGDVNNGRISSSITLLELNEAMEWLRHHASHDDPDNKPKPVVYKTTIKRPPPRKGGYNKGGGNSGEPKTVAQIYIGRHPDGYIFLCLEENNRPRVAFPFMESDFNKTEHNTGEKIPLHILSNRMALAYARTVDQIMALVLHDTYTEPQARPKGNYNNNRNNNSNNNYNNNNNDGFGSQPSDSSGDNAFGF